MELFAFVEKPIETRIINSSVLFVPARRGTSSHTNDGISQLSKSRSIQSSGAMRDKNDLLLLIMEVSARYRLEKVTVITVNNDKLLILLHYAKNNAL